MAARTKHELTHTKAAKLTRKLIENHEIYPNVKICACVGLVVSSETVTAPRVNKRFGDCLKLKFTINKWGIHASLKMVLYISSFLHIKNCNNCHSDSYIESMDYNTTQIELHGKILSHLPSNAV